MRLATTNGKILAFLFLFFLAWTKTEALEFTVQVTLNPDNATEICSLTLLQSLDSVLTNWVSGATTPVIPDFQFSQDLTLTAYDNSTLRHLLRKLSPPQSCTHCTSSGCSQYCGNGVCRLCASSRRRRLALDSVPVQNQGENNDHEFQEVRELLIVLVDFAALGQQVSASVQTLARAFLSSPITGAGFDCLGDPSSLTVQVIFLV